MGCFSEYDEIQVLHLPRRMVYVNGVDLGYVVLAHPDIGLLHDSS